MDESGNIIYKNKYRDMGEAVEKKEIKRKNKAVRTGG